MSDADDDDDSATTWVLCRKALPYPITRPAADTLEMRIVLYDELELVATRDPDLSHRKLAKDSKTKRTAAWMASLYLSNLVRGCAVSDDERWVLIMWCAKQRNEIRLNPRGRGRPHDYTKDTAVRVAYARKLERAPQQKKESIVTELAKQYGLKRRQVLQIIKDTDPELLLRVVRPLPGRPVPQWSGSFPGDSPYGDGLFPGPSRDDN